MVLIPLRYGVLKEVVAPTALELEVQVATPKEMLP
jgi:uncharacterized protein YfaS (alpha-2-macroglobulin family)